MKRRVRAVNFRLLKNATIRSLERQSSFKGAPVYVDAAIIIGAFLGLVYIISYSYYVGLNDFYMMNNFSHDLNIYSLIDGFVRVFYLFFISDGGWAVFAIIAIYLNFSAYARVKDNAEIFKYPVNRFLIVVGVVIYSSRAVELLYEYSPDEGYSYDFISFLIAIVLFFVISVFTDYLFHRRGYTKNKVVSHYFLYAILLICSYSCFAIISNQYAYYQASHRVEYDYDDTRECFIVSVDASKFVCAKIDFVKNNKSQICDPKIVSVEVLPFHSKQILEYKNVKIDATNNCKIKA